MEKKPNRKLRRLFTLLKIFGLIVVSLHTVPPSFADDINCQIACNILNNKDKIFKASKGNGHWGISFIKGFADGITEKMDTLVGPLPTILKILSNGKIKDFQGTWGTLAVRMEKLIENNPELAWKIYVISSGNFSPKPGRIQKFPGCIFAGAGDFKFIREPKDAFDVVNFIMDVINFKLTASPKDAFNILCGTDNDIYIKLITAIFRNDVKEIDSMYQRLIMYPDIGDPVKFAQSEIVNYNMFM